MYSRIEVFLLIWNKPKNEDKNPTMHLKLVTSFYCPFCFLEFFFFLINTNCYVTLMPLKALEVCEVHLYAAACSTEHEDAAVHGNRSRVCWVRIYGNPYQPPPPPLEMPTTQEVNNSMAQRFFVPFCLIA